MRTAPRSGRVVSVAALALPLAEVGEVGEGFFKERTSETLPCQAKSDHLFCFDWAKENIGSFTTPTEQHLELVLISVVIGFANAFSTSFASASTSFHVAPTFSPSQFGQADIRQLGAQVTFASGS